MDYQRCALAGQQRTRAVAEVRLQTSHRRIRSAVFLYHEIGPVAGVWALRISQSMFFRLRIEMFSGGLKLWTFTLGKLVKVDRVRAWWEIFEV